MLIGLSRGFTLLRFSASLALFVWLCGQVSTLSVLVVSRACVWLGPRGVVLAGTALADGVVPVDLGA